MCGRARQSPASVSAGRAYVASSLPASSASPPPPRSLPDPRADNLSPGRSLSILHLSPSSSPSPGSSPCPGSPLSCAPALWGMVPPGTAGKPHAPGVGKHFQAQMYNTNTDMCTRISNALAPAFRRHLSRGRTCVVPLDGIYEWAADPTVPDSQARKVPAQPYYAHRPDGSPLLAAGLYSLVPTGVPGEPPALHFSLLTSPAGPPFADLAARSPVLLTCPADVRAWLSPDPPPSFIHGLCGASRAACGGGGALSLRWHPVSKDINKVGNVVEKPHLEVPLAAAPSVEGFLTSGGGGDAFKSSAASPAKKEGAAKRGGIGTFFPKAEPLKKKARRAPSPPAAKKAAGDFFKASPARRPAPAAAAWACAGCTFLNAAGVGECEMCGGAPP